MKKRKAKSSKARPAPERPQVAPKAPSPELARVPSVKPARKTPSSRPSAVAKPLDESPEPTVRQGSPMPVMMIALLGLLLYLGEVHVIDTAGDFDPRVYYPYQSVKQLEDLQPKSAADAMYVQGRKVYNSICIQCHQANGQGNPAMFIPPLVGSDWVLEPEPGRIIRIVFKGLQGPITVKGENFGQGAMFAVGDQLPGNEEERIQEVAAVLTYIRSTWGNSAPPVTIERVQTAHEQFKNRTAPWTADELLKLEPSE